MTNNTRGFEIATDIRRHLLRVTLWGLWDADLAKKYRYAMQEKIEKIVRNGKEWYGIADFTRCYPRSDEVQDILREQIVIAKEQGMKKIVYLGERAAIELRLDRIFREDGNAFIKSEEEAIQWLLDKSRHN